MPTIHIRCARRRVFGDWRPQHGGQDSPDLRAAGEYCWQGRSGAIRGADGLCFWERGGGSGRLVRGDGLLAPTPRSGQGRLVAVEVETEN